MQLLKIFDFCLVPTLDRVAPESGFTIRGKIIFRQDNDPKNTTSTGIKHISTKRIPIMNWSSQFPNLNQIEHLWGVIKWQLSEYLVAPKGIHKLCA